MANLLKVEYLGNVWKEEWELENASRADMISHAMQWEATKFSYNLINKFKLNKEKKLEILDLGCGSGAQTLFFLYKGFQVSAIDIEKESVVRTLKTIRNYSNENYSIKEMNAEEMTYYDETFDVVYINCMLMHTNSKKVISEAMRVLKKGGLLVIKEVKKDWIFSFPYRTFSPYRKTKPKYIAWKDIKKLKRKGFNHKEFYLTASAFNGMFFLNQNVGYILMWLFQGLDNFLFKLIPPLRQWSWTSVLWKKK